MNAIFYCFESGEYRRPTSAHDPTVRSDDGDGFRERDYDISNMASNLSHDAYRYSMFDNEDADEVCAASILAIWVDFFVC